MTVTSYSPIRAGRFACACAISLLWASPAHAVWLYFEYAGGAGRMIKSTPTFTESSTSFAASGVFTAGLNFSKYTRWVHFHLGLRGHLLSGSGTSTDQQLLTAYPLLRMTFLRFFVTGGATPVVVTRDVSSTSTASMFSGYSYQSGAIAGFGEAGYNFPVIPWFMCGLAGTAQFVKTASGLSPAPALSAQFYLRFYFSNPAKGVSDRDDWEGWRYPFGRFDEPN